MKSTLIFIVLLFCSCTNNKFYGHVYDYDTEQPLQNVFIDINGTKIQTDSSGYFYLKVNSNSILKLSLRKDGYSTKNLYRKPDSSGGFSKRNLSNNKIYLFNEKSDFSKK
ncbi:hypothetical protein KHA90_08930 [Flavobacterium psychroterrae]|uniref:Carboxypeptidase-like regulatory domain-containing protein n=1 Tax=Flavobacterium psychroterrae TaxID=2133767 RepID=A0ABS5PA58_9FLAO|nr:hypothetical protein [Flavobacterium psychroterrae]MBS7231148.1 hypothetical protein [Flavobacterium psychroterrae]